MIFDLDDTLIETSKCLTPYYLRLAFNAMQKKGLSPLESPFEKFLSLNQKELSSEIALKKFIASHPNQMELYKTAVDAFKTPLPDRLPLEIVSGAIEVLDNLQASHTIVLVTAGEPSIQWQKLEKAGIQPERFSKIVISKGSSKKNDYQIICSEFGVEKEEILVCGDRISRDLTPAKELGFCTVHFRNGRGQYHVEPKSDVDFTITTLTQLYKVCAKYEN